MLSMGNIQKPLGNHKGNQQDSRRFLLAESDCLGKRRKLQPGDRFPTQGTDFVRAGVPQGGANGKLLVKKTFLKRIALQNYRLKLLTVWHT